VTAVTDEEIVDAWRELAALEGIFCEPSSAAGVAAVKKGAADGLVVCTLTGHGLKDPATAERHAPAARRVDPDPDAIAAAAEEARR
jgi:threonine synthase